MALIESFAGADARRRIVDVHGESYIVREYIGKAPLRGHYVEGNEANDNPLPQGFLVSQPAGAITRPHFHETNQFQVFVAGSGRFGKRPALPLTVQFAGGHTPYGPIVAGDEGLEYFTLRQRWEPGAKYMPAMRDRLVRGRQRQHLVGDIALSSAAKLRARCDVAVDTVIEPEDDGLLGCVLRLPPGGSTPTPAPSIGGGQYQLVVNGELHHEGTNYPSWSCQFVFAHDQPAPIVAGDSGLELLVLRFPQIN